MAQTVGELQIVMSANMARLSNDMRQAKGMVGSTMSSISRSVAVATSVLGALGLGLGVAMFARMVKGSLEAQDQLSKMSQKVGVSVEALAGLKHAAELSGFGIESLQKGLKTLASQMFDAQSGLLESKRNFSSLGLEITNTDGTLKATDKLMVEVADKFAKMNDGALKTALAVKLFGKAGLDLIPMLNQGSAALAEMIAEGQRLNPVTTESAKQAEIFNDQMSRVVKTGQALGVSLAVDVLPWVSDVSSAMAEAAKESGVLTAAWVGLGGAFAAMLGITDAQKVKQRLAEINEAIAVGQKQLATGLVNPEGAKGFFAGLPSIKLTEERRAKIIEALKAIEVEKKAILAPGLAEAAAAALKTATARAAEADAARKAAAEDATKKSAAAIGKAQAERQRLAVIGAQAEVDLADQTAQETAEAWDKWGKIQFDQEKVRVDAKTEMWRQVFDEIDAAQEREIEQGRLFLEANEKATDEITEFWRSAAQSMQRSMSDFFFDIMQGNLKNLGASFKRTIDRMVSDNLAAKAATSLFGKDFAKGGAIGGLLGKGVDFVKGLIPFEHGTDFVPRTGPALVHKGEKIISAKENARGGEAGSVTLIQNYSFGSDVNRATLSQWGRIIGQQTLAAVRDMPRRGG